MNRKPVDIYQDPTIRSYRDNSLALVAELAGDSVNLKGLLTRMQAQQLKNDDENLYSQPWAQSLEATMSYVGMALEAAARAAR